jgi:tetratricopeptide (TPR) repeat protein
MSQKTPSYTTVEGTTVPLHGVAARILALVEYGLPSSLLEALNLLREKTVRESEFGRTMAAVIRMIMESIYPDIPVELPPFDPSQSHPYTKALRYVNDGVYVYPVSARPDYLEYILPFFALLSEQYTGTFDHAVQDLQKGAALRSDAVLAPYFLALIDEHSNRLDEALRGFETVYQRTPEMYPAGIGIVRIYITRSQFAEALNSAEQVYALFPTYTSVVQTLALAYYYSKKWAEAENILAAIVAQEPSNSIFCLLYASVLVEERQFFRAQPYVEQFMVHNPRNRLALFLSARIQAEGYRNTEAALGHIRALTSSSFADDDASVYAIQLLRQSARAEDQADAQSLLNRLLALNDPSLAILNVGVEEAIKNRAWLQAEQYILLIMRNRKLPSDLLNACIIYKELNIPKALQIAQELYQKYPQYEEGVLAYIAILIDSGQKDKAHTLIEQHITESKKGAVKSRYYYLRSRTQTGEESIIADLRLSIFENPRNIDTIIALFLFYHTKNDKTRAQFYFRQALSIDPQHPQVQQYRNQYSA